MQGRMSSPQRSWRGLAFSAFLALAAFGCGGSTTGPADQPAAVDGPLPSLATSRGSTEAQLNRQLEAEKARIKAEEERSKATYDRLKIEWDRFLKNRPSQTKLLICDPLSYAADTKIIGPEGGDMSIGPHKLRIPRGALSKRTVITGEMPVTMLVAVKLSPHGLVFNGKGSTLELSYKHCYRPRNYVYRLAYINDLNQILEWPLSFDNKGEGEVEGVIRHFSRYAVAF